MLKFIKSHKTLSTIAAVVIAILLVVGGGYAASYLVAIAIGAA